MASFKLGLYILVSAFAFHLLLSPVICGDKEGNLLHDINTYRIIMNLPVLEEDNKASCLAEKIADDLEDKPCDYLHDYYPVPGRTSKFPSFEKSVKKCKININTTSDGVIMPVCVPKLDAYPLLLNYTKSNRFSKYLNSSKYTIAGVGSDDDWMVLIVSTTNKGSGDFSAATSLLSHAFKGHCLVLAFFLSLLIVLFN